MNKTQAEQFAQQAPGADPILQGYWASVRGEDRVPPDWHPAQLKAEFIDRWFRGHDEHQKRKEAA